MANTLTDLIPDLYASLDVVSRELSGMTLAVTRDSSVDRAALNQAVRVPIAPAAAASDITPSMTVPGAADQIITNSSITISKQRAVPFSWKGSEQGGLNSGGGYLPIRAGQMAQAIRTLVNEVEVDLCALQSGFSRATGVAGTIPFATAGNLTSASLARQILVDNGAPLSDNHLILGTTASSNLIGLQGNASVAFNDSMMSQGLLANQAGFQIRESAGIVTQAAGTAASATTDSAGYAVGATVITLASAGTGTLVAGDVVTFAGDANKYVLVSGDTNVADGGTITLAAPGLRVAMSAATKAITVVGTGSSLTRNVAFNRSAIVLATRMPERPEEGDEALDVMTIVDPRSGLAFEVAMYGGYRMVRYEVALAWGVKNIKPEHTALLVH